MIMHPTPVFALDNMGACVRRIIARQGEHRANSHQLIMHSMIALSVLSRSQMHGQEEVNGQ